MSDLTDIIHNQDYINFRYLLAAIEQIHEALCPDQSGTWQQRVEQAVTAARKYQALRAWDQAVNQVQFEQEWKAQQEAQ